MRLFLLLFLATPALAKPVQVCTPGGPVKARQAKPAIAQMLRVLERLAELPTSSFEAHFEADPVKCRAAMAEKKPALAILSLGLFLEHRTAHHLVPLARPRVAGRTTEALRVVVKRGTAKTIADLKGKTLSGTPLVEPEFLAKLAFTVDPRTHFVLQPSPRPLRSLRALNQGDVDAVLLTAAQHASIGALPFAGELEVIHTTPELPMVGIVADGTQISPADQEKLRGALAKLCADAEGKTLCEVFGLEAFEPVGAKVYVEVIGKWGP